LGIRRSEESLKEAKTSRGVSRRGAGPERAEEWYFPDWATLRKALSSKRLALRWTMSEDKPRSVRALAEQVERDMKEEFWT
jgi:predicted transcriptional regulator